MPGNTTLHLHISSTAFILGLATYGQVVNFDGHVMLLPGADGERPYFARVPEFCLDFHPHRLLRP